MILLYHEGESGQVGLKEGLVEGFPVLARRYDIVEHFIAVDVTPDAVAKHDAEDILQLPGVRLATAKEQNQYAARVKAASAISEQVGG